MLDDIIEFILELILDGVVIATESKKVPLRVRIFLAVVLVGIFIAAIALIFWVGINSGSVALCILAGVLLVLMIVVGYQKIKEYKKKQ